MAKYDVIQKSKFIHGNSYGRLTLSVPIWGSVSINTNSHKRRNSGGKLFYEKLPAEWSPYSPWQMADVVSKSLGCLPSATWVFPPNSHKLVGVVKSLSTMSHAWSDHAFIFSWINKIRVNLNMISSLKELFYFFTWKINGNCLYQNFITKRSYSFITKRSYIYKNLLNISFFIQVIVK